MLALSVSVAALAVTCFVAGYVRGYSAAFSAMGIGNERKHDGTI